MGNIRVPPPGCMSALRLPFRGSSVRSPRTRRRRQTPCTAPVSSGPARPSAGTFPFREVFGASHPSAPCRPLPLPGGVQAVGALTPRQGRGRRPPGELSAHGRRRPSRRSVQTVRGGARSRTGGAGTLAGLPGALGRSACPGRHGGGRASVTTCVFYWRPRWGSAAEVPT